MTDNPQSRLACRPEPGEWEYQCRLNPLLSDGTPGSWHAVDPEHNCGGELRRRWVGIWEGVER